VLNTFLRQFVSLSITDWVEFIKLFTMPDPNSGELWRVNDQPLFIIHLRIKKREKKKKDKKKTDKKNEKEEEEEEEVDDEKYRIIYKPSIKEC
jgi:hypothetical protein